MKLLNRFDLVVWHFYGDEIELPSNFVKLPGNTTKVISALQVCATFKTHHRFLVDSFAGELTPMMQTMKFAPWTAFTLIPSRNKKAFLTSFRFSNPHDMTIFKLAWMG